LEERAVQEVVQAMAQHSFMLALEAEDGVQLAVMDIPLLVVQVAPEEKQLINLVIQ
jgi:hypothetical protein